MLGPELDRAALITPALHSTQVQTFHGDLLQHMEKNTKLDMQFIKVSLAAPPRSPAHHRPVPTGQTGPLRALAIAWPQVIHVPS